MKSSHISPIAVQVPVVPIPKSTEQMQLRETNNKRALELLLRMQEQYLVRSEVSTITPKRGIA